MPAEKQRIGRFRVGDWVTYLYGPSLALAQVVEDRGPLGGGGRRVLRVRVDQKDVEPTFTEVPEEELEPATEADRTAWQAKGSVALHQAVAYRGHDKDRRGHPKPLYQYLVLAKYGPVSAPAVATIIPMYAPNI